MRTCKICGTVNEDGAVRCSGCGIRFTEEPKQDKAEAVTSQSQSLKFPMRTLPRVIAAIFVFAIAMFVGRTGFEKLSDKCAPFLARIHGTRQRLVGIKGSNDETWFRLEPIGDGTRYIPVRGKEDAEENVAIDVADNVQRMPPYDLGQEFGDLNNWRIDWEGFLDRHPNIRFRNDGQNRHSVLKEYVLFYGYPLCDDTLVFSEDGLETIEFSLFNMGDEKTLAEEDAALEAVNAISEVVAADRVDVSQVSDGNGKFIVNYDWVGSVPHLTMVMGVVSRQGVRYAEFLNGTMTVSGRRIVSTTIP